MKNLKRALSFALASVMVIGMMVIGAGAADFTDADKIVNDEAVNTLVALNVINGKGDGSYYDPAATLTRAEAAKLIVYILHGGKAPVIGTKATPTYADIDGNWAEAFIEYCSSTGIIAGWDGKFNPNGTLTGSALAKMLLVAMNYDAEVFGLVGNDWEMNTNVEANKIGMYEDLDIDPSLAVSRDNAAQMIWNAVQAKTMELSWGQNMSTGVITQNYTSSGDPLLVSKFGAVMPAPEGTLSNISYVSADKGWQYTITPVSGDPVVVTADEDYTDLYQMNVKVIYKDADTVYGIYAEDSKVIAEGYTNAVISVNGTSGADKDITVAGVKYATDDTTVANYYAMGGTATITEAAEVKAIDKDGDGKVDTMVYTPFTVGKVTYVSDEKIRADGATWTLEDKDLTAYEGIAKNDWVAIYAREYCAVTTKDVMVKAELKTGTVDATKAASNTQYKINGTWFTMNGGVSAPTYNDTVEYVAYGSVVYYLDTTAAENDSDDIALVITAGAQTAGIADVDAGADKAVLLYADGTKETVTVSAPATGLVGQLVTYYVNSDKEYVLTAVSGTNTAGYDDYESTGVAYGTTNKVTGSTTYKLNDDAVVFLFRGYVDATTADKDNKGAVITGAEAKELVYTNYAGGNIVVLGDMVNGFGYADVALMVATDNTVVLGDDSTTVYGYLTADTYVERINGDYFRYLTIWTADGEISVKEEFVSAPANLTKGQPVKFEFVDATEVENVTNVSVATKTAVTGLNGDEIKFNATGSTVYELDDETVYIYIESANDAGAEKCDVAMADKTELDALIDNVYVVVENTGYTVDVIYIDVNNEVEV